MNMKKLLLFCAAVCSCVVCSASSVKLTNGSLSFLSSVSQMAIVANYDQCRIYASTYQEWKEENVPDDARWNVILADWYQQFTDEIREALQKKSIRITDSTQESDVTMMMYFDHFSWLGANMKGHAVFIKDGKELATITVSAPGGEFGSDTNLMGDAHAHSGKAIGRFLANKIK